MKTILLWHTKQTDWASVTHTHRTSDIMQRSTGSFQVESHRLSSHAMYVHWALHSWFLFFGLPKPKFTQLPASSISDRRIQEPELGIQNFDAVIQFK